MRLLKARFVTGGGQGSGGLRPRRATSLLKRHFKESHPPKGTRLTFLGKACYDLSAVKITVTEHARRQAEKRGIPEQTLVSVVTEPQQTIRLRSDREVRQSRTRLGDDPMEYLVRVIVDRLPDEIRIITAYRTSKIGKYWEQS